MSETSKLILWWAVWITSPFVLYFGISLGVSAATRAYLRVKKEFNEKGN